MNFQKTQVFKANLITKGRKTGKEHKVTLRAVKFNDRIYFSRHRLDGDWIKNAISYPLVKVEFDNSVFFGKSRKVIDENLAKKISQLKYPGEEKAKEPREVLEVTLYEQL